MSERTKFLAVAAEVIAAADNTYGLKWREWHKSGPGEGARRLSRALCALEEVVSSRNESEPR